jgi:predicted dehydrogenase
VQSDEPLRGAVLGLGMIGRHHARILQTHPEIEFAGAVDQVGDRFEAVKQPSEVLASIAELIEREPDFAVVAVPTGEHLGVVRELVAGGVSVLVEKPIAADSAQGAEIIHMVRSAGLHGAVGHVERFNPALQELRTRVLAGQLGEVFLIATERVGPFPARIRDVGVVKDLGTHDLDLVRWLGGSPVSQLAAQTQHRMGREHEDMVLVTGRLAEGQAFNCIVDWLSPTKVRQTRVLGELGMLVADTLSGELTFYEFKGGAEGDVTSYALAPKEPLEAELEAFCALLRGDDEPGVVTLEEGLETVVVAEAVLSSAVTGETVQMAAVPS